MAKDKPSMGLLVLGKPKDDDMAADAGGGAESAAAAAIKAIKSGDAGALSEALKLHWELCQSPDNYEDEE
jgi:hypothetical protein